MTGGLATRLGDLAKDRPKSMVKVRGRPFLEFQLEFLKRAGVEDVVLCTGYLGGQIESYFGDGRGHGVNMVYSLEDRPLGTAGALKNAEKLLEDPFFTMYGDSYVKLDFRDVLNRFKSRTRLALMTVYRTRDRYDRSNSGVEGDLVTRYSKAEKADDLVYIDYGVNLFRKRVLDMIPPFGSQALEGLFPQLIARRELLAYRVEERFYEIGSPQGLREFEELAGGGVR